MYKIIFPNRFKKDLKLAKRRGLDLELLYKAMDCIESLEGIPTKYKDHILYGRFDGHSELHVQPDWLLIYRIDHSKKTITYARAGTHSDLFNKIKR